MMDDAENLLLNSILTSARAQVMSALFRYFGDLVLAEEAFQNSCLKALQSWPQNGPPRDPTAWLILVGRNAGIDEDRRRRRTAPLPEGDQIAVPGDSEGDAAERLDGSNYRDDILRLLFICCHPDLPPTQQIALALRVVSGLSTAQIARAFLVHERTMQQRITRAKATVAAAGVPFDAPTVAQRAERLTAVLAILYLIFNEGYSCEAKDRVARWPLCVEAIRLGRILLGLFSADPEIMGLVALMLLHHARSEARFDSTGALVLMRAQDRSLWKVGEIAEGLSLIDKAMRHRNPGPYQIQAAIAALHVRAAPGQCDWAQINQLYLALERISPSPVIMLNRAVAVAELSGAQAALDLIEPLEAPLSEYFHFHGVRGGLLLNLGRIQEAEASFQRAIGLARSVSDAVHIRAQLDRLKTPGHVAPRLEPSGESAGKV